MKRNMFNKKKQKVQNIVSKYLPSNNNLYCQLNQFKKKTKFLWQNEKKIKCRCISFDINFIFLENELAFFPRIAKAAGMSYETS